MEVSYERNDKKRSCTGCRRKMKDGMTVLIVRGENGKPRGYYCDDDCKARAIRGRS